MTIANGMLYLGGNFTQVGPYTGPFTVVDATLGLPDLGWPHFDGQIEAIIPDGQGGWYVGGTFDKVGGLTRRGLAHLHADASIDSFAPFIQGVKGLALAGTTLYVVGLFQDVSQVVRNHAAAFDITSGALLPWAPIASPANGYEFKKVFVDGSSVYLTGNFDVPSAIPRRHFAAVDAVSGALLPLNPNPNGAVLEVVISGSTLYLGGNFTTIAGQPRTRLASLNKNTGVLDPFAPAASSTIESMALDGSVLYIGGLFTNVGGQQRSAIAAVDASSGAVLPWDPQAGGGDLTTLSVEDLLVVPGAVYASGTFRAIGGTRRLGVAQLDATSGLATHWVGDAAGETATHVRVLARQGWMIACGGNFLTMGGARREGALAFDLSTGALTPWNPVVSGGNINRIVVDGPTAWIAGSFDAVNGLQRPCLASVDAVTGTTNWQFFVGFLKTYEHLSSLAKRGNVLYAGGSFAPPAQLDSVNFITLNAATGDIVAGSTRVGGRIDNFAFSADGSTLYLAGNFGELGNPWEQRMGLAAVDPTNGSVLPWDPQANNHAYGLHVVGDVVFAGGKFTLVNSQPHARIVALDRLTGLAVPAWNATILKTIGTGGNGVTAIGSLGGSVFAGGNFNQVNGNPQEGIAALRLTSGELVPWSIGGPTLGGIETFVIGEGVIAMSGANFIYPLGERRPYFAVYAFD